MADGYRRKPLRRSGDSDSGGGWNLGGLISSLLQTPTQGADAFMGMLNQVGQSGRKASTKTNAQRAKDDAIVKKLLGKREEEVRTVPGRGRRAPVAGAPGLAGMGNIPIQSPSVPLPQFQFSQANNANAFSQLQQQLEAKLNAINVPLTPIEQLQQQANSQAAAQFDPSILALQGEMSRAGARGRQSKADARNMYGALAENYVAQIPELTNRMNSAQDELNALYENSQDEMRGQYEAQQQQQADLLRSLGIQAAAGNPQGIADQSYFMNQAEQDERQQADMLRQYAMADQSFLRQQGNTARLAGENRAQEIESQTADYLGAAGDKLAGLQGAKGNTAATLLAQLQTADQERAANLEQQQYERIMALNDYAMQALGQQNENIGMQDQLRMELYKAQLAQANNQANLGLQNQNAQRDYQFRLQQLQQQLDKNNQDFQLGQQRLLQEQNAGQEPLFKNTSGMTGVNNFLAQQYPNDPAKGQVLTSLLQQLMGDQQVREGKQQIAGGPYGSMMVDLTDAAIIAKLQQLAQGKNLNAYDMNSLIDAWRVSQGKGK